ncbi:MAG: DUF2064 domain-containing protein [Maribacter sp.]
MNFSYKTAVLVFANSSHEELLHKPMPKSELLFDTLTQETLKKVKKTGLPYFHLSEKEQKGKSFGERFTNAIQTVFDQGFENIITIGNDTPQLQTRHLLETKGALDAGRTVLGPSVDGGFYLMGIHKSNFEPESFKNLPWQRFSLLNRISFILDRSDALLYKLPVLGDIDNIKDVKRLISFRKSISSTLLNLLTLLIAFENRIIDGFFQAILNIFLQRPFNKGSPLLLHS